MAGPPVDAQSFFIVNLKNVLKQIDAHGGASQKTHSEVRQDS